MWSARVRQSLVTRRTPSVPSGGSTGRCLGVCPLRLRCRSAWLPVMKDDDATFSASSSPPASLPGPWSRAGSRTSEVPSNTQRCSRPMTVGGSSPSRIRPPGTGGSRHSLPPGIGLAVMRPEGTTWCIAPPRLAQRLVALGVQRVVHLEALSRRLADDQQSDVSVGIVDQRVSHAGTARPPTESPAASRYRCPSCQRSGVPSSTKTNSSSLSSACG